MGVFDSLFLDDNQFSLIVDTYNMVSPVLKIICPYSLIN